MLWALVTILFFEFLLGSAVCQEGKRDDSHVENVVRQAVADEFSSEILTNRTRAYLSCASGEMVIKVNFSEPFRGVTYTDYDRSGPCKFYGDGRKYYELRIPLKGCGTKQEAPRVFINNIIVRFHRSLELEEDEIKTIICRYPPPLAPLPPPIVPLLPTEAVPAIVPPKLSEVELLLIICALLFLTLLLLGIGIAYYCLKKRNIKVIKKRKAISSGPGSEITKLSGSTMGTLSMFDPIRIPRAIAQSTSGSEAALLTSLSSQNGSGDHSDTIPSDYPSESPSSVNSDVEEIDNGRRMMIQDVSTMRGDHFRYENTAFIPDEASSLEGYPEDRERADSVSSIPVQQIMKPKLKTKVAREQVLTTISEREDGILQRENLQKTYAAVRSVPSELIPPVGYIQTYVRDPRTPSPPASSLKGSIPDNDIWSHSEYESEVAVMPYVRKPKRETATVTDYYINTQTTKDIEDDLIKLRKTTTLQHKGPSPVPSQPPYESDIESVEVSKALVPRKPKIVVQNIDDVYLTTTTEIQATETVTKTTKDTIAQLVKTPPQSTEPPSSTGTPPNWDVTIRHYPNQPYTDYTEIDEKLFDRRWDTYSEVSEKFKDAESTTTEIPAQRRRHPSEPSRPTTPKIIPSPYYSNTMHKVTKTIPHPTYTSIIYKILEPPSVEGIEYLTPSIKEKWRTVITTDETFRYLVQEATTVEEYIRITKDSRYEKLFDTRTWHVIIRALSTPDDRYPPVQVEPPTDVRNPRYNNKVTKTIPHPTYASIIYKVLDPPSVEGIEHLTPSIKEKWRTVITTDETFRYLVQEATTVEEYIRITKDSRYEKMFDTRTWHVIIRALSTPDDRYPPVQVEPPADVRNPRYKKKNEFEPPRNRRSSLPPVTEFSLARDAPPSVCGSIRSRRTSRSGSMPDYDLRSMTEVDVDFAHADRESLWSVDTGYTYKTTRSLAERSTSEFLEEVPTIVAEHPPNYRGVQQQSQYYVEQSVEGFVRSRDSYLGESSHRDFDDDHYSRREPLPTTLGNSKPVRPRFLERSSTEYFEDVPTLSLPDLRQSTTEFASVTERRTDNVVRELRQNGKFSRSEVIIDSPIMRAIDRASSIGEREEIKSVTETDVLDWKR